MHPLKILAGILSDDWNFKTMYIKIDCFHPVIPKFWVIVVIKGFVFFETDLQLFEFVLKYKKNTGLRLLKMEFSNLKFAFMT